MKVLVTGAKGMLGQDLCPILEDNGFDVIETDIHNLDITDYLICEQFLIKEKPDIVIHCAAYTNVDEAEKHFETAKKINVIGTENIAKACEKIGAVLAYISTDYVFDGEKNKPYKVDDIPNPINNYGLTKLEGENAVKKICTKYYIIRTSWLYGHHGKNFVETMLALKNEKELKVVNDQFGCPTWTIELANGIVKTINTKNFGVYQICGSGMTSWYDFAKEIFEIEGLDVNIVPCSAKELSRLAKRPSFSVMENDKICKDWSVALRDYMALRIEEGLF